MKQSLIQRGKRFRLNPHWSRLLLVAGIFGAMLFAGCTAFMDDFSAESDTETATGGDSDTGSQTDSATHSDTETQTISPVDTLTDSQSDTPTDSVSDTVTDSVTDTFTDSVTDSASDTVTDTASDSVTDSASDTVTDTASDTDTHTDTPGDSETETERKCRDDNSDDECDGWIETFQTSTSQALSTYDSGWVDILGQLNVSPTLLAAESSPGDEDDNDDYAYKNTGAPIASMEIIIDLYWSGNGAICALAAVKAGAANFYEANIWDGELSLYYFNGNDGGYTKLDSDRLSDDSPLQQGAYRMKLKIIRNNNVNEMSVVLQDPANNYATLIQLSGTDSKLPPGYPGMGIWSNGYMGSYISQIQVIYY